MYEQYMSFLLYIYIMKRIFKILVTTLGISALTYLVAREKVLLKKTAHDCSKLNKGSNYEEK